MWGAPKPEILISGAPGSGKTTLLYKLKLNEIITTIPTIGFNVETVKLGEVYYMMWDLQRMQKMGFLQEGKAKNLVGIVHLIREETKEGEKDLKETIEALNKKNLAVPILVLLNSSSPEVFPKTLEFDIRNNINYPATIRFMPLSLLECVNIKSFIEEIFPEMFLFTFLH